MNIIAFFEIQSSNPKREIKFYESVFGWSFVKEEQVSIEFYRIETPGIHGALLKRQGQVPKEQSTNAFTCSIMVADYNEIEQRILQNRGRVALAKFAVPGRCWQGYYLDPDNNIFGFLLVDKNAQ